MPFGGVTWGGMVAQLRFPFHAQSWLKAAWRDHDLAVNFVADPKVGSYQPATFFAAYSLEMKSQQCVSVAATWAMA